MTICPECGSSLTETITGSSLLLSCANCGWKVARSWTEPINEDATIYSLRLRDENTVSKESLAAVSKITGCNYIAVREMLREGGAVVFSGRAPEVKKRISALDSAGVNYSTEPQFPY